MNEVIILEDENKASTNGGMIKSSTATAEKPKMYELKFLIRLGQEKTQAASLQSLMMMVSIN